MKLLVRRIKVWRTFWTVYLNIKQDVLQQMARDYGAVSSKRDRGNAIAALTFEDQHRITFGQVDPGDDLVKLACHEATHAVVGGGLAHHQIVEIAATASKLHRLLVESKKR